MAQIEVRLVKLGEGQVQYESVAAFLVMKDKEFLLDSVLLDAEDYEDDLLERIESFCGNIETMANENDIKVEFDEEIDQRTLELNIAIDNEENN